MTNPFATAAPTASPFSAQPGTAAPLTPPVSDPFSTGDPFAAPVRYSRAPNWTSLNGRLLLIKPTSMEQVEKTDPRDPHAAPHKVWRVTSDIDVLDGAFPIIEIDGSLNEPTGNAFEDSHYEDVWVEPVAIANSLKAILSGKLPGQTMILFRLGRAKTQKGFAWTMADPTDDDKMVARRYLARRANPLA